MSSLSTGRSAEHVAAEYLKENHFKILEHNWRTKYCEIDIIAKKDKAIYFVEVKYRKNYNFGSGLESIGHKKLNQMRFAAEMWVSAHQWRHGYQLAVIAINEEGVTDFTDSVDL